MRRLEPLLLLSALLCMSCGTSDGSPADPTSADSTLPSDSATADAADGAEEDPLSIGISLLNIRREAAGLAPVSLDENLSIGCLAHVRYMQGEGKVVHEQDPASPYFSEAGAAAGKNGNLAGDMQSLQEAIDYWLLSLYHRLPLLDPGVQVVGAAFEKGYACIDLFSGFEAENDYPAVAYPYHQQAEVPTSYTPTDVVHPLPSSLSAPTGPIVSLMYPPERKLGEDFEMRVVLEATGALVESFTRLPDDPSDPYATYQLNTVVTIPTLPLQPGETYRVLVTGSVDESLIEKQWLFTTSMDAP